MILDEGHLDADLSQNTLMSPYLGCSKIVMSEVTYYTMLNKLQPL